MKFSTAKRTGLTSTTPATIDAKARITGTIRATGSAQAPRPTRNLSARSTSLWVTRTYLPHRLTSGRPPARPTP
jgi:hypothetical protein